MQITRVRAVAGHLNILVGGWVVAKVVQTPAGFELHDLRGFMFKFGSEEQAVLALQNLLLGIPL